MHVYLRLFLEITTHKCSSPEGITLNGNCNASVLEDSDLAAGGEESFIYSPIIKVSIVTRD